MRALSSEDSVMSAVVSPCEGLFTGSVGSVVGDAIFQEHKLIVEFKNMVPS